MSIRPPQCIAQHVAIHGRRSGSSRDEQLLCHRPKRRVAFHPACQPRRLPPPRRPLPRLRLRRLHRRRDAAEHFAHRVLCLDTGRRGATPVQLFGHRPQNRRRRRAAARRPSRRRIRRIPSEPAGSLARHLAAGVGEAGVELVAGESTAEREEGVRVVDLAQLHPAVSGTAQLTHVHP